MAEELLLCPGCAKDYQGDSGLCGNCYSTALLDNYVEQDHQEAAVRREHWKGWTESSERLRMRQQRHRLKNTRPRELAGPGSDPLLLAAECLEHLRLIKAALGAHPRAHGHLDEACELVKQLGWGPEPRRA